MICFPKIFVFLQVFLESAKLLHEQKSLGFGRHYLLLIELSRELFDIYLTERYSPDMESLCLKLGIMLTQIYLLYTVSCIRFKETVSVISSDPSRKNANWPDLQQFP